MMSQKVSFIRKAAGFILNIGADPRDSDYVRLIKRIWYVSSVFALPVSLISGLAEIWIGNKLMAGGFFFSFAVPKKSSGASFSAIGVCRPPQLGRRIIEDVQDFATGTEPCDDITLVIIKRAGESSHERS